MSSDKKLIIIPTYNEKDNIRELIERINSLSIKFDILVVDDTEDSFEGLKAFLDDWNQAKK